MQDWSDGYITEVGYTHSFFRELSPHLMRFALLCRSLYPPALHSGFRMLELGCGQGFSLLLSAAANPESTFVGIDLNPIHIAGARRIAAAAGLDNIHFIEGRFEAMRDETAPSFDIIALHGVWSWVSRENRQVLVDVLRTRLASGGMAYVSYNTDAGWAAQRPLRELMMQHVAADTGPMDERIGRALHFLEGLQAIKAPYFSQHADMGAWLERVSKQNRAYLAHEYFNRDWEPQAFAEVSSALAEARLSYAGPAWLTDHIDAINFPPEPLQYLQKIANPVLRETTRDLLLGQTFRRDLYVRGAQTLSLGQQNALLRALRFTLITRRDAIPLKVTFRAGTLDLAPKLYEPLLDALADGPKTLGELAVQVGGEASNVRRLMEAMLLLCGLGHTQPLPEPLAAADYERRRRSCEALNRVLEEQAITTDLYHAMASPVLGGGTPVNRLDLLFLHARRRQEPDPVAWVWSVLASQGQNLIKDGRELTTPAENQELLRTAMKEFIEKRLSVLAQLDVAGSKDDSRKLRPESRKTRG